MIFLPIDTLYDYFKTIYANTNLGTDDEIDGIKINELCENLLYNNILNGVISESEISETITKTTTKNLQGQMVFLMITLKILPLC